MTAALASRLIECALDDGLQQGTPPPPGGSAAGRDVASELGKHRESGDEIGRQPRARLEGATMASPFQPM